MGRIFVIVLLLGALLCGGLLLGLGAFPPDPKVVPIQKVLPNDKFGKPG